MGVFKRFLTVAFLMVLTLNSHAQKIRIATYQYAENNRIANITPLAKALERSLGDQLIVKSYPTVQALISAVQKNEVDIALINTFGFLLLEAAKIKYPMQPLFALHVPSTAQDNYKTAIFSSKKSGITSMQQLAKNAVEKRLLLVNIGSTSGNLVPRLALSGIGLNNAETDFKALAYGKTHQLTIEAVADGKADIGAIGSSAYFSFIENNENVGKINLLWMSPEIPLGPVLVNDGLSSSIKAKLRTALLNLHEKDPAVLLSVKNGWSEAKFADQFIPIKPDHYQPFIKQMGNATDFKRIIQQFVN